jgi:hypothetical protein
VWPVSGGCLLLRGTWSYFCICRRSVLPYTRFCNCLLDYDYVLHNVNFTILYSMCSIIWIDWLLRTYPIVMIYNGIDHTFWKLRLLIDWSIIYCFTSHWEIFHLYGDVNTVRLLNNLRLCSAFRAFEQGEIFIVPHLLWHGASVFLLSFEGPPHSVASYDTQGGVQDLF